MNYKAPTRIDSRRVWELGINSIIVDKDGTFKMYASSYALQNKGNCPIILDDAWTLDDNEGISDNVELNAIIVHQYRVRFDTTGVPSPVKRLEVRWMGLSVEQLAQYEETNNTR